MSSEFAKVKSDKLTTCMTCPICDKILEEATTISLCLHTFCRKCIYDKLSDEDVDTCPVCDIDLGGDPEEKLRPDHNWQNIIAKIFPLKGRKVEVLEIAPLASLPAKGKEDSMEDGLDGSSSSETLNKVMQNKLLSLPAKGKEDSMEDGLDGSSSSETLNKVIQNKLLFLPAKGKEDSMEDGLDGSSSSESLNKVIQNKLLSLPAKGKEDSMEDGLDGSSSSETLNEVMQNQKQGSPAKSSNDQICDEHIDNNNEGREGKVDMCKPLNTLVEARNRSKFSKSNLQGHSHPKGDPSNSEDSDIGTNKTGTEEYGQRAEVQDGKSIIPSVQNPTKRKKQRPSKKNRSASQVVATEARRNWKDGPIWFSLVASEDQERGEPLPQIPAAFLRVKDGSMPVSYIQKYIVKKLDLANEAEVQIMCEGHPVLPDLQLSTLLDAWLHISSTPKRVPAAVGDSAKEFVMVLSYSKKVAGPTS